MSIASRHGKLFVGAADDATRWTRIEDLLTADVFGAFRYLPPEMGLLPFLAEASRGDGVTLRQWAAQRGVDWSSISTTELVFWPAFGTREPDVLVALGTDEELCLVVLVEAKLHAGQHWIEGLSQLGYYGQRLLDDELLDDLIEGDLPALRPVVFLTKATDPPRAELEQARSELDEPVGDGRTDVFGLSWHAAREVVARVLADHQEDAAPHVLALVHDLLADLEHRGFAPPRERLGWPLPISVALDPGIEPSLRLRLRASRAALGMGAMRIIELAEIGGPLRNWRLR